jgi:hypothetical protein
LSISWWAEEEAVAGTVVLAVAAVLAGIEPQLVFLFLLGVVFP